MGFISFSTDDGVNIGYFKGLADYVMSHYNMPMSMYVSYTQSLSADDINNLHALYAQGDEIGTHTRHHTNLGLTAPIKITYSGSGTGMAAVVSGSGSSLSITGSTETHGPVDLTSASYDTVGELCTLIGTWTHFACVLTSDSAGTTTSGVLSNSLKDATTGLAAGVVTNIPYDDSLVASNRLYTEEITNSVNDLESVMHSSSCCTDYHVKTMAFPDNESTSTAISWIKANTGLIATRSSSPSSSGTIQKWLGSIDPYHVSSLASPASFKTSNYASLTTAQQKDEIEQAARAMATYASNGYYTGFLSHTVADLTQQEFQWFLDELDKYVAEYHISVSSYKNLVTQITTSGDWTNTGGIWTRTFPTSSNFQLLPSSVLINAGTTVAGRTSDILNDSIVGVPDIGAYEFRAPSAPSWLAQRLVDGTTITPGGWINQSSVVLQSALSSANTVDSIAPQAEIRESGTSFSGAPTNIGNVVATTIGGTETGSISITGLRDGRQYHWQIRENNPAATSSWVAGDSGIAFGVDLSAPSGGSITTPTGVQTTGDVALNVADGTDTASGINIATRAVQRRQATLNGNVCGSFGGWGSIVTSGTYPSLSDTVASGRCYQYRYLVSDNAQNQITYLASQTVMVAVPTAPAAPPTNPAGVIQNTPAAVQAVNLLPIQPTIAESPRVASPTESAKVTVATGRTVTVHVVDTQQKPVAGVLVVLHSVEQRIYTNRSGVATFQNVASGHHTLEISYANYKSGSIPIGDDMQNPDGDVNIGFTLTAESNKRVNVSTLAIILPLPPVMLVVAFALRWWRKKRYVY